MVDVLMLVLWAVGMIAAFWVPIGLVIAYSEQVKEMRAGSRQSTSVVLGVFATLAGTAWVLGFIFYVIPYTVTETIPGLLDAIGRIGSPVVRWLFSGVSGTILAGLAGLLVLTVFFIFTGWAVRVGWRLHDSSSGDPITPDQHDTN